MQFHRIGLFLVVMLLVSAIFFTSAQQSFADTDLTVINGQTYVVDNGDTLSITGVLTVDSGGKLIVEDGGTINIDGSVDLNGIINSGEIEQFGTIAYLNPIASLLVNQGSWIVNCGFLDINGLSPTGQPIIVECNEEIILDILDGIIPFGTTVVVDDEGGKTVVLETNLVISGTLVNSGFLSNRALITLDNGLIDLSDGGTLQNVCNNFPARGINLIGTGQINEGIRENLNCNNPIATIDTYSVLEDATLLVDLGSGVLSNDTPGDNDHIPGNDPTLYATILTNVSHGSITLNTDGSFEYTPNPDYVGPDSFIYTLTDGNSGTATATVNITVTNVNDPPTANNDSVTTAEDTSIDIAVLSNDEDPDNDPLTVINTTGASNGVTVTDGTTVTYTPNPNYFGSDSFTYTISDGNGGTDSAIVTVTVTSVNDPPIAVVDAVPNPANEGDTVTLDGSGSLVTDGTILSYFWTQTDGTPVFLSDMNDISPTFTAPPVGPSGEILTFSLVVTDDNNESDQDEITVQVNNVNDPPIANNDSVTTAEDTSIDIAVLSNDEDPDNDDLTVINTTGASNGVTVTDGTTVTYTPNPNYFGSDSFTYTISDGNGGTDSAIVTVTITSVNDAPICSDATSSISEIWPANHKMVTLDYAMSTEDVDGDATTLSIFSVFQDEPTNAKGDGDTSPDADLENNQIRAERSAHGDGRVYVVTVIADDGNGGSCTGSFEIGIPHDKNSIAVNSGAIYDSTEE